MTNCIDKTKLIARLTAAREAMELTRPTSELTVYAEEDLDTNPDEAQDGGQDEPVGGIIILDPATSAEDRKELVEFYRSIGMDVQ